MKLPNLGRAIRQRQEQAAKTAAEKKAALEAQIKLDNETRIAAEEAKRGRGYTGVAANKYEMKAGVTPVGYEGSRDRDTGQLLEQYRMDPYSGEAQKALKEQAFATGESPWARMQLEKQAFETGKAHDAAATSQAQAIAQAQANLMRQGGLSSGARTRMAMQGAKDLARAQQGVEAQGVQNRMGIQAGDIDRKQNLLSNFANAETGAQGGNIATLKGDVQNRNIFDGTRYKEQMAAWAAEKTANAQAGASKGGKK